MPDYRSLPSVTSLASSPELEILPEKVRILVAQRTIESARRAIADNEEFDILELARAEARSIVTRHFHEVKNMSGVILHTGLGRAPTFDVSGEGYSNLEFDLETGKRGDRQDHVRHLLCELTGAEDAMVVNNGAAGVLLTLTALCQRKEVLLSRGQSVEIGGSFRMPDVIKASGCKLIDVGATNKTYVRDFEEAITPKSAAILRCHPSNFEIRGFVEEPSLIELASLAHARGILFINDQGNGAISDFAKFGLRDVETLPQSVAANVDITIGSGDKLLGGPQCGIILGRKELISKLKKHPLARALRIDKNSLLILQATLRHYLFGSTNEIPLFKILEYPAEMVFGWCEAIVPDGAKIVETITEIGSGAAPGQGVKSYAISLDSKNPDKLLANLRKKRIIGRIHKGQVLLDPRTVAEYIVTFSARTGEPAIDVQRATSLKKQLSECWNQWK